MTAATRAPLDRYVPPEIVSSVFHSATVSDNLAILVAESRGGTTRLSWGNQGAVHLLGYGLEDLRQLSVQQLFPSLRGGELGLLLRRERTASMNIPVRSASGALIDAAVSATPRPVASRGRCASRAPPTTPRSAPCALARLQALLR